MDKYLVVTSFDGEVCTGLWTSKRILDYMDMDDCFSYDDIQVYRIQYPKASEPLTLHYAWHKPKDPLYLSATDPDGNVVFDGYGTDH